MDTIKVVVAEADELLQRLYSELVDGMDGYETFARVSDGAQLFDAMRAGADFALLDIFIEKFDALEGLAKLFSDFPDAGCIVLSSGDDKKVVSGAFDAGAFEYLAKPFSFEALRSALRDYLVFSDRKDGEYRPLDMEDLFSVLRRPCGRVSVMESQLRVFNAIQKVMADGGTFSAQEVADAVGVSRATARRYLEQLSAAGRAAVEQSYGRTGRPEKRYRLMVF